MGLVSCLHERSRHQHREKVSNLVPESVEELDRIDQQEDADSAFLGLQVLEDVLGKEVHDVDEDIGRGDSMLKEADRKV